MLLVLIVLLLVDGFRLVAERRLFGAHRGAAG